jgi:UDP-N-acetyl-D-glucosamine/UDP-N-acetyl-D-galactosamine dehydrogenase
LDLNNTKIAIIGLGYVGLPLSIVFSEKYRVFGYDVDELRVDDLNKGIDVTREFSFDELSLHVHNHKTRHGVTYHSNIEEIKECTVFIVCVPTPIDEFKKPDLRCLRSATNQIGCILKQGDLVIYESTTYPGCTEEFCVPILENTSGLKYNEGFYCGYSPERINVGDKVNTIRTIKKVTSGSTPQIADFVDDLYNSILLGGTHKTSSIKVAEASKAVENAQRDVNISFVNELALIFDRLNISTTEVLEAARTKWNFLDFRPGLVGGHCIGVDPYYLAHKAESKGYHPAVLLSGRRVNDSMAAFVASKMVKLMIGKNLTIKESRVLILGLTFKENCTDIRNSKLFDVRTELMEYGCTVDVLDPWVNTDEVKAKFGFSVLSDLKIDLPNYKGIILGVSHSCFRALEFEKSESRVVFDLRGFLSKGQIDGSL